MKVTYYKSKKGNFGDDLNDWLWKKIFKDIPLDKGDNFIGIGSLLHNDSHVIKNLSKEKKIVFGSGIKPSQSYSKFKVDNLWDIKFLRGPLSAMTLDNNFDYITDAAYAMRLMDDFDEIMNLPKKYEISLMPYFHSVDYFDWKSICAKLGYHYISPLSEDGVEFTIREIASSKRVVTEAMHGAIVADILRVPWHRFILSTPHTEGERISDFKWNDWMQSISIYNPQTTFIPFYKKNKITKLISKITNKHVNFEFMSPRNTTNYLINKLNNIDEYHLSSNETIQEIDKKLSKKVSEIISEHSSN